MTPDRRILIINPNTTVAMTEGLKPLAASLGYTNTSHTYHTAPSGPSSINSPADAEKSYKHTATPALFELLRGHDAGLVACYSEHPLVPVLRAAAPGKPVTGIFEASVAAALLAVGADQRFGIVSTGVVWEKALTEAVGRLLGVELGADGERCSRFAGVETTGLNAIELHDAPPEEVKRRMVAATRKLLRKGRVGAVCLGCAGMAGMDEWVREACVQELGEEAGGKVKVVDGVKAGVLWLDGAVRAGF